MVKPQHRTVPVQHGKAGKKEIESAKRKRKKNRNRKTEQQQEWEKEQIPNGTVLYQCSSTPPTYSKLPMPIMSKKKKKGRPGSIGSL